MEILKDITINLTVDDISQLVEDKVKQLGFEVDSIHFNITSSWEGYGITERQVYSFDSVDVKATEAEL